MKLKLTLVFIALAVGIVYLTFKKDFLSYQSTAPADMPSSETLSKDAVANYFQTTQIVDYRGAKSSITKADFNISDRVIVHLWASWCAPCVNEVPDLIEFARKESMRSSKKTTFITVSLDESSDDLNKFLKSFPDFDTDTFIRVWDKESAFSKLVNADRLPMTIMLIKDKPEPRVVRGVVDWKTVQF